MVGWKYEKNKRFHDRRVAHRHRRDRHTGRYHDRCVNGVQGRAYDAAVKSDFDEIGKKMVLYQADNGNFPTAGTGASQSAVRDSLRQVDIKLNQNAYTQSEEGHTNLLYFDGGYGEYFVIVARSKSNNIWYYDSRIGTTKQYSGSYDFPHASYDAMATDLNVSTFNYYYVFNDQAGTGGFQAWT